MAFCRRCWKFLHAYGDITWTRLTLCICFFPIVLIFFYLASLFLLSGEAPGAVVSNTLVCADVGKDVLMEDGSAIDAAIATMLCEGVALPTSAGIGGGFSAIMFVNGNYDSIVATPTAPSAVADEKRFNSSFSGGAKSAGIPGELMGYWEMHRKYGVLSWKRLFEPTIRLCEEGIAMTQWLANSFKDMNWRVASSPTLIELFPDWETVHAGSIMKFPIMAKTLRKIADQGAPAFYNGEIGKAFIKDLQDNGGVLTEKDLKNFKVEWNNRPPTTRFRGNLKVVTTPLPTTGALTILILNIIKNFDAKNQNNFWHYFIEAIKHALGRAGHLGDAKNDPHQSDSILKMYNKMLDPDFARQIRSLIDRKQTLNKTNAYGSTRPPRLEDLSVSICVSSKLGDTIVVTSSLLHPFGACFASTSTGIIVNNLFRRYFHLQTGEQNWSPANRPLPGKRSMVHFTPTLLFNHKFHIPYYILGVSGGSASNTITINSIIEYCKLLKTAALSINSEYLHNRLFPNRIEYEFFSNREVIRYLKSLGHKLFRRPTAYHNITTATCVGYREIVPKSSYNLRIGGSSALISPENRLNMVLVFILTIVLIALIFIMIYEVINPRHYFAL